MVVNLKPQFVPSDRKERNLEPVIRMLENDSSDALLDPDEVLEQADLLRGVEGQEYASAILLTRAFEALVDLERWIEAEKVAREVLELKVKLNEPRLSIANTYHNIGLSLLGQNRLREAENILKKTLKIKKEKKDTFISQGITAHNLARVFLEQEKFDVAEKFFRKSLELSEKGGDSLVNRATTLHELAQVLREQNKFKEAEEFLKLAVKIKDNIGSTRSKVATLNALANIFHDQDNFENSEKYYREALKILENINVPLIDQGVLAGNLGQVLANQGKFEEAKIFLLRALALKKQSGDTLESLDITRNALIDVLQKQEHWRDAENLIQQALKETESQTGFGRWFLWNKLEKVLIAQGRMEEAQEAAKHALAES
jgi:tetratricopeptide (TPR) repeat protein